METPTQLQIIKALPHVRYEIESLLQTPEYDRANKALKESVFFRKMAHGRVLFTFFSTKKAARYDDDILSEDFSFDAQDLYYPDREKLLKHFNKRLFHLTYSRIDVTDEWNMNELLSPVMCQSRKFIEHILKTKAIAIEEVELQRWRDVRKADTERSPLQQNTSNVAEYQIQAIELKSRI